jgi:hypothetical protein
MRLGVRTALEGEEVEICAEAEDARQAIREAKLAQPDMCLVGADLRGGGIPAIRGILDTAPSAAVILLAGTSDADQLLAAILEGAARCCHLRTAVPRGAGRSCAGSRGAAFDGPRVDPRASADHRVRGGGCRLLENRRCSACSGAVTREQRSPGNSRSRLTVQRHTSDSVEDRSRGPCCVRALGSRCWITPPGGPFHRGSPQQSGQPAAQRVNGRLDAV